MNQINAEGFMTHQRIEQIVSYALDDEYKLRQYLQQARVAEMKMQLNMKKLEGEIELLKVHNRQFEGRLEGLQEELEREKKLPQMLQSMKQNVFDRIRKVADHLGPSGLHMTYNTQENTEAHLQVPHAKPKEQLTPQSNTLQRTFGSKHGPPPMLIHEDDKESGRHQAPASSSGKAGEGHHGS